MSDKTSPNDDVVRWQQEKDLGHPLSHMSPEDRRRRDSSKPERRKTDDQAPNPSSAGEK